MTVEDTAQWVILGRYRVLGELGRGAMGIVYKVHDERLDRTIALKTIRKDRYVVEDEPEHEVLERFRREARAAGKLSHAGIVTIYDINEEGEDLYITMEFVDGESLGERMRATPRTPVAEAARIATRICEALEYAHAHGVVHRDIKPDNIMCCANGDVKLTDFGIARIVSGPTTRTGRPIGTPRYMAPEQWRGDHVDGRADVFAVGIILYELLTGGPTFSTKSTSELMYKVLHEEPALPTLMNPALPAAIDPIVRRAIAREPSERYPTAGEVAQALAPFVTGPVATPAAEPEEPVTVPGSPFEETTVAEAAHPGGKPGFPTGRAIAIATALGAVALTITGVWWTAQPRRSLPMPEPLGVATEAPVAVRPVERSPQAVETTAAIASATSVAATVTAAAPSPEIAPAYRDAGATLADPEQSDAKKLSLLATLATDSSDAATDVLLASTRNASILVSMAAVKALVGRPCPRIMEPLTALLADEEWRRRAWAAKILGANGCVGAREALAARRGRETDGRVTKLVDDAIKMLDTEEPDR